MKEYYDFVKGMKMDPFDILDGLNSHKADMLHMGLGLIGEFEEVVEAVENSDAKEMIKECGDFYFYFHGFIESFPEWQFGSLNPDTIDNPLKLCGKVGEFLKKVCIQGKQNRFNELLSFISQMEAYVSYVVYHVAGVKMEQVLKENMKKLSNRHPNGFDKSK